MKAYLEFAQGIADGKGYVAFGEPTAYWPVGYPATLAGILKLSGGSLLAGRLAQAAFGTLSVACVYFLAPACTASQIAALAATTWAALDVVSIAYTSILVSEPLFNALMLLGAALAVGRELSGWRLLAAGAVMGLAAYTRAHGLLLPLLCGAFGFVGSWRFISIRARRIGWLYLGLALVMSPWWFRNAMVFEAFVPVSNNGGINLFIGNNPQATGGYKWNQEIKAPIAVRYKGRHRGGRGEYQRGQVATQLAHEFMWSRPDRVLGLARSKLELLYKPDMTTVRWNKHQATDQKRRRRELKQEWKPRVTGYHLALGATAALGGVLVLGVTGPIAMTVHAAAALVAFHYGFVWFAVACLLVGVVRLRRETFHRTPAMALPLSVVVTFTMVHVVYFASGRFLFPIRPWLAVLAGMFVAYILVGARELCGRLPEVYRRARRRGHPEAGLENSRRA